MLLWRLGINTLPTRDQLMHQEVIDDLCCNLFNQGFETPCHLFFECTVAKAL